MNKNQIHQVAADMGAKPQKVIDMLKEIGIEVKGVNSTIDDEQLSKLHSKAGYKAPAKNAETVEKDASKPAEMKHRQGPVVIRRVVNRDIEEDNSAIGRSTVRRVDSGSGLMSGYRHDEEPKLKKKSYEKFEPEVPQEPVFKKAVKKVEPEPEVEMAPVLHKKKKVEEVDAVIIDDVKDEIIDVPDTISTEKPKETVAPIMKPEETKSEATPAEVEVPKVETVPDSKPEVVTEPVEKTEQVDRPAGDRPAPRPYQGDRPAGDRPAPRPYQGDRPAGDRPAPRPYQGDRPAGDRPAPRPYQGDRPAGDRPAPRPYQGDRPAGDRPAPRPYQGDRPAGDRPAPRPYQGDRPQGAPRPYGDRPQGGAPRPYGDRPQGGAPRPYGDRPQGGAPRPYGDRPQGGAPRPYGDRPQGGAPRPYGDRPQGGASRPYGDRNAAKTGVEIPKPDTGVQQKEDPIRTAAERGISRSKEKEKEYKKEQKRDTVKTATGSERQSKIIPNVFGKKGVSEVLSDEFVLEEFYTSSDPRRRRVRKLKHAEQPKYVPPKVMLTNISLPETISVKELAEGLKKTASEIIKRLMALGVLATLNSELDYDTAAIICEEYEIIPEKQVVVSEEDILFDDEEEDEALMVPRDPVVVVMGHVDHGKTSLLDAIRDTNVIKGEAGGITQHIGAYRVEINNRHICFLDTPGHEAFTAMRARGAQVTDVAVLVVAADDGVMPQTVEAIDHAKAAGVKIVVAINKIDKEGANPDKIKQELTEHGIVSSAWGGDTEFVEVSAKLRTNIQELLEIILLEADVLELKANPNKQAKGTVIEAKLDRGRGPVATILVQRGTLNEGDTLFTGSTVGRIRAMVDDTGKKIKKAGPSTPVEIIGLPDVPVAGEIFYAVSDEKLARQLAEKRKTKLREQALKASSKISLDDLYKQITEGIVKDLNIIVKADVQGSVEAIRQSLAKLSNEEVRVNVIHGGVGAISESDISLAQVSNAIIIGFNVRPGMNVTEAAETAGVDMRMYSVIYNAIEDIQSAMKGLLEPTFKEVVLGHAEVRELFKVTNVGTIAGCYVTDGKITRNAQVRVVRGGIVAFDGIINSLKRFKDDAKEVATGFECGIMVEKFNDMRAQDIIEAYIMEEVKRD